LNPEVFADWLRRQGHHVERTASSWWYDAGPRVYQAFPFHWVVLPSERELTDLLRRRHGFALRYSTPLDAPAGCVSYHAICDDRKYGLHSLNDGSRRSVRNALAHCRVERIPLERYAAEGWQLEADTCRRQGREVPLSREAWRRRYLAAAALPGFEAWGALVDGRLGASLACFQMDDCVEILAHQSLSELLDARLNNALTFVVTEHMLRRPEVRSVFYTLQSLDAPASIDTFKFRMGYVARPLRQRVVFHPWAGRVARPWVHRLVRAALARNPESRLLAKGEGMLRFHLQGSQPASMQEWPACLKTDASGSARTAP
jgi:hypothetical protein